MQKPPLLLRRPLPPKFTKPSLHEIKTRTAKTGKTGSLHVTFTEDETTSIKTDKTRFPDVLRNQSLTPINIQNIFFGHCVQERVTAISSPQKPTKHVYEQIPDTATGSIFFPRCHSASTRIFGKQTNKMESSRKLKTMKDVYTEKRLENILILSSKFSKPESTPGSVITHKLENVHPEHQPLPESPGDTYQHISRDLSATLLSPPPTTVSVKPEGQWPEPFKPTATLTLKVTQFPGFVSLPTPILPRKPHRQSVIETLVAEHENVESVPKQILPRAPEGLTKTEKIESEIQIVRGEGFKTVAATRYETITAMTNLAIVNCQVYGRNALNLKGFFILHCPDLTPLAFQLIYLNLSFNDLHYFPTEILCLKNLQILKLRNNPIKEIPSEIQQLEFLRIFTIAFNLITVLPTGLFSLSYLEELDVSYNELTFIPNEIQKLRSLERLTVDGNELNFFPHGILKLNLTKIQFENNFTHPCFWRENSLNNPQQLTQIISLFIVQNKLHKFYDKIPVEVQKLLKCTSRCEWCHGPKFGEGFRVIRSCDIFGASQLPVMFHVCSSSCYRRIKESSFILDGSPSRRIALDVELSKEL
ncbi:PREDICTED: leucine-rich repeat-containing protein 63 [Colobus angolensis palliatus]|uniref:Leucine rich repeat containing 63 n=1 Tax=Colobus angolensis palliatus TaxID=336983 RepID=A0A2K5KGJ8_COLAP|nr:PREDICTED: leucine-rich repeat-containing protein 63 [Colobus angolensis palliatus]